MSTGATYELMRPPRDGGREGRFSTSLCAGLSILASFTAEHPVRGIADVAEGLGMGRSTIHRYATTLTALGYLEQGVSRKYRLAPRGADIGLALMHSMPLRHAAHDHLRELRTQTGHTVAIAVLVDDEIVYVDQLHGHRRGQYAADLGIGVGTRVPAHRVAAGKALLAHQLDGELEQARGESEPRSSLLRELRAIRGAGLAGEEELFAGRRALAAPVLDRDGAAVAAVEVSTPLETFSREELAATLAPRLRNTAEQIGSELDRRLRAARVRVRRTVREPLRAGR